MKIYIDGVVFDSAVVPIILHLTDDERANLLARLHDGVKEDSHYFGNIPGKGMDLELTDKESHDFVGMFRDAIGDPRTIEESIKFYVRYYVAHPDELSEDQKAYADAHPEWYRELVTKHLLECENEK